MILNCSDLSSYSFTVLQDCYTTWKTQKIKKYHLKNRKFWKCSLNSRKTQGILNLVVFLDERNAGLFNPDMMKMSITMGKTVIFFLRFEQQPCIIYSNTMFGADILSDGCILKFSVCFLFLKNFAFNLLDVHQS